MPVHIDLPIHIGMESMGSSIEVLGIKLDYAEVPVQLSATLHPSVLPAFRDAIQFREGQPQDTVDVAVRDRELLLAILVYIFKSQVFATDMSVEQPFVDHLSEALAVELSRSLGLNAIGSPVEIPATDALFDGLADSLLSSMESSPLLRQLFYEQYLQQSPERFPPGTDADWAPIPFTVGDTISFFLTLRFQDSVVNGSMALSDLLPAEEMPIVRFVVRFSFS